ncbi:MAG: PRC-barrel domain-containing protein [Methanobacterium sp.]
MKVKEEIIGKEVIDMSAMVLGKVKDVEVNLSTNEIEAIVLGSGGGILDVFGQSREQGSIPYRRIKQIGDKVLLKDEATATEPE